MTNQSTAFRPLVSNRFFLHLFQLQPLEPKQILNKRRLTNRVLDTNVNAAGLSRIIDLAAWVKVLYNFTGMLSSQSTMLSSQYAILCSPGETENKANSDQLELKLRLSLAKRKTSWG
jgi:hypothetical protein